VRDSLKNREMKFLSDYTVEMTVYSGHPSDKYSTPYKVTLPFTHDFSLEEGGDDYCIIILPQGNFYVKGGYRDVQKVLLEHLEYLEQKEKYGYE